MIVVNTESIPGMRIVEVRGLVQGNTVRAKHVGRDIAVINVRFSTSAVTAAIIPSP